MSGHRSTPQAGDEPRLLHRGLKFDLVSSPIATRGGGSIRREFVRHPGAVTVVGLTDRGQIPLVRQYRVALSGPSLELPAGTISPPETPRDCAARELREETGYDAATIRTLGRFYPSPGLSDELMHVFAAADLTHVGQDLEDDESIEVVLRSPAQIARAIADGKRRTTSIDSSSSKSCPTCVRSAAA
ncbi:MAG: NUDIX hydrolase, partial [Planctomycetota bacterium]